MFAVLFGAPAVVASKSVASCRSLTPFPNTDLNDGNEASSDPGPVVAGILGSRRFMGDSLNQENDCCATGEATAESKVFSAKRSS